MSQLSLWDSILPQDHSESGGESETHSVFTYV
jgi:hypothetical protein